MYSPKILDNKNPKLGESNFSLYTTIDFLIFLKLFLEDFSGHAHQAGYDAFMCGSG